MILAAGFGTRMGDLTRSLPKPLLPLNRRPIIELILLKLKNAGIRQVIINLHYQKEPLKNYLKKNLPDGIELFISEEEEILGTGGGIAHAESFFRSETVLVVNSDILCDISLADFEQDHQQKNAVASMAVYPSRNYGDYSLVLYDKNFNLKGFLPKGKQPPEDMTTGIFTGYQILTPEARRYLQPVPSSVIDAFYRQALREGKQIAIYPHSGQWIDLGTKENYRSAVQQVKRGEIDLSIFI
ncbi:MAG: hypothetical protein Kow0042_07620 [Calditrichia bacterium]